MMKRQSLVSILITVLVAIALLLPSPIAWAGPPETMGDWDVLPLPAPPDRTQSVHTVVLPNGKVLSFNGSSFRSTLEQDETGAYTQLVSGIDVTDYDVVNNTALLDPETGTVERVSSPPAILYGEANDLFCAGHLQLADGNVLVVSGTGRYYPGGFTGSKQLNLYHWKTGEWSKVGQMKDGRWYPTLVSLANGNIVILSGLRWDAPNQVNPSLEIYDPATETLHYIDLRTVKNSPFNTLIDGDDSYDTIDLYPRTFSTADGKLLLTGDEAGIGPVLVPHTSKKTYLMSVHEDEKGEFSVSFEVGPNKDETAKAYGTGVQVPGSEDVLLLGGMTGTNSIDFGRGGYTRKFPGAAASKSMQRWIPPAKSGTPIGKWELTKNFFDKTRVNLEAVILPDKKILVINGGEYPEYAPVYAPLLLTPDPEAPGGYQTTSMNAAKLPRLYHNGAVLLPDARVLVLGGNTNRTGRTPEGELRVDIERDPPDSGNVKLAEVYDRNGEPTEFTIDGYYNDPQGYFTKDKEQNQLDKWPLVPSEIWQGEIFSPPYLFQPGPRPEIVSAPAQLTYGEASQIEVSDATGEGSVVMVKLGSITHSFDMGQRLADVTIDQATGGTLEITAPTNANLYPPGYYMMFYLNNVGKPSHAQMVQLVA